MAYSRLIRLALAGAWAFAPAAAVAAGCPTPSAEVNGPAGQPLNVDEGGGRDRLLYEESHALLIGEANYATGSGWRVLGHVPSEIDGLAAALRAQGFHVVRHNDLNSTDLPAAIECFVRRYGYRRDSRIVIYFAGHGFTRTDSEPTGDRTVGYVLPVDVPKQPAMPGTPEETALIGKAIRLTQFQEWAGAMEARHVLLLFDSCFSGAVLGHRGEDPDARRPRPLNYVLSDAAQSPVRWFLTSGTAKQTVPAESYFNSLLVQALTGLRPEADVNHDGFLTSGELVTYLKLTVPSYNPDQTPDEGRIRDALLDVGDMVFRLPDRGSAAAVVRAAAASQPVVLSGQSLNREAVLEIARPTVAPPAPPAVLATADQTALAKAVQELESKDPRTRRRARVMLSRLLGTNGSGFVGELVRGLPHGSYRFQLGVAEALSQAPGGWQADDQGAAVGIVRARAAAVRDPSLKQSLSGALRNARA